MRRVHYPALGKIACDFSIEFIKEFKVHFDRVDLVHGVVVREVRGDLSRQRAVDELVANYHVVVLTQHRESYFRNRRVRVFFY